MPRAGGDYVWMTRIFHSPIGFVIAAVGWWFILWLWTPIYADMGVQTTIKPIFRIIGLNGAADWLGSRTGIFVASLCVIAIASILVAVGMKTYANFQKWAMWIGLGGVIVCGILLLVTSGDASRRSSTRPPRSTTAAKSDCWTSRSTSRTRTGLFVYDERVLPSDTVEGETYAGRVQADRGGRRSGTGMPTSTFSGRLQLGHLGAHPVHDVLDGVANWGATLYGEVRGAKDFRKNIYQMLGGLSRADGIALAFLG